MKVPRVRISQLCGMWLVIVSASVASAQTTTSPSVAPANTPSPAILPEVTAEPSSALPGSGLSNQTSDIPSDFPSDMPSMAPTPEPTFETISRASARFRQEFRVENGRLFNDVEILLFQGLYASYTSDFAPPGTIVDGRVNSTCIFLTQSEVLPEETRRVRTRRMQNIEIILVDFVMEYASLFTNVTTFPEDFQRYIISDLDTVAEQMQLLGLNVSEAFPAVRIVFRPDPTAEPTPVPTLSPTVSLEPSSIPSDMPSLMPSAANLPATSSPSASPTSGSGNKPAPSGSDVTVIVVSVLVAVAIVLGGIYLTYRRKRQNDRKRQFQNAQAVTPTDNHHTRNNSNEIANGKQMDGVFNRSTDSMGPLAVAASPSIISNQSLLSAGNSIGGDSGDEVDTTHNLADEFDQYKDQNLEKMRAGVEGNLTGFDGMMSQALTRALIDEDDSNIDATELLWGGSGQLVGAEIEASALGEVSDWLKRKDAPSDAERRLFMQETLNKMVASVRHGVLGPEEASRSIHECAALLGLQLATEIPVTTLIITGMRKTVTADDLVEAFAEFGDISEVAVASNQRGFGILRFKSLQSVDRAMKRFRTGEIVVQDVGVNVKVLRPGSNNSSNEEEEAPAGVASVLQ